MTLANLKKENDWKKALIIRLGIGDDWGVLDWLNWNTFSEEEKRRRLNLTVSKLF